MKAIRRQSSTLAYLEVQPDGYDQERPYPMVVLLHGFGANMADLAGLAPAIDAQGYVYVCPNAPLAVPLGPGAVGYAWTPPRGSGQQGDREASHRLLNGFLTEIMERFGVSPDQMALGGFSQGGMMTYHCGLTTPDPFRGLIVLSGRVPDPDELRPLLAPIPSGLAPTRRGSQPIFVAHGTQDSMISVEDARASRRFLEEEGYAPEYREYAMGHEITPDVVADLVPWLHRVLPPARDG